MSNKSKAVVLFRKDWQSEEEMRTAATFFNVVERRSQVPPTSFVICRYSALPYYAELEADLAASGSVLINSFEEHRWIASFEYYDILKKYTFESWDDRDFYKCQYDGPFVVKGRTNSKKHRWNQSMYAENKAAAVKLASELMNDMLIAEQGVIYRKYVPLKTFEIGLHGLRFTNEWRFFYLGEELLTYGYYWTNAEDPSKASMDMEGIAFANEIAAIAAQHVNFFVLDIAEKEEGGWVLVEINDAQMSGLSANEPYNLYSRLKETL